MSELSFSVSFSHRNYSFWKHPSICTEPPWTLLLPLSFTCCLHFLNCIFGASYAGPWKKKHFRSTFFLRVQHQFCCCANSRKHAAKHPRLPARLSGGAFLEGNPLILFSDGFASTDCITDSLTAVWQPPTSAEGSLGVDLGASGSSLRSLLGCTGRWRAKVRWTARQYWQQVMMEGGNNHEATQRLKCSSLYI